MSVAVFQCRVDRSSTLLKGSVAVFYDPRMIPKPEGRRRDRILTNAPTLTADRLLTFHRLTADSSDERAARPYRWLPTAFLRMRLR